LKDIDCGAVVSTYNDPENPYEFVVRNVYAKEADARYKTNWTETQLHFNHDASHLFHNDELIEFHSSTAPALNFQSLIHSKLFFGAFGVILSSLRCCISKKSLIFPFSQMG